MIIKALQTEGVILVAAFVLNVAARDWRPAWPQNVSGGVVIAAASGVVATLIWGIWS